MKRSIAVLTALMLLCLGAAASADVFNLGAGFTSLETVIVGDSGNLADSTGYGAVNYNFNIGKYEVTAKQYTDFLNAKAQSDPYGLYNASMWTNVSGCKIQQLGTSGSYTYTVAADYANRPVNFVSYWDACRFANWLSNGQGSGDTETGTYTLTTNGMSANTIIRNIDWKWAVTSENEWYKAAYYKAGGTNAGYWLYPTSNNTLPGRDMTDVSGNNANYYINGTYVLGTTYRRTEVGEFQSSDSAYGTFDQGGNVWEWNEATMSSIYRGMRGGCFGDNYMTSATRYYNYPTYESIYTGFRISGAVPEPASVTALAGGLIGLCAIVKRRRRS